MTGCPGLQRNAQAGVLLVVLFDDSLGLLACTGFCARNSSARQDDGRRYDDTFTDQTGEYARVQ